MWKYFGIIILALLCFGAGRYIHAYTVDKGDLTVRVTSRGGAELLEPVAEALKREHIFKGDRITITHNLPVEEEP